MSNPLDFLTGKTDQYAATATNSALDAAAARPFAVVLSVEVGTQLWIAGLVLVVALIVIHAKRK